MPFGPTIGLRVLYAFLFSWFCCMGILRPVMSWLDAHYGVWVMLGGMGLYAGIARGTISLINKINRDWPTLDVPPQSGPMWDIEESITHPQAQVQQSDSLTHATSQHDPKARQSKT